MIKKFWKYLKVLKHIADQELIIREKLNNLRQNYGLNLSQSVIIRFSDEENVFIGKDCRIGAYSEVIQLNEHEGIRNSILKIGDGTTFGSFCNIRAGGGTIDIGKECLFAQNIHIIASNHKFDELDKAIVDQPWDYDNNSVYIGDFAWVGCNAVILPGAKLGKNCIVAAGAVVTKGDYKDGAVLAGNPAREIKNRYLV